MTARLLVFGRRGQVAAALARAGAEFELIFAGRERLDLAADAPDIAGLIAAAKPAAVINAAAYTAVDAAEAEPDACARLNRDAPVAMARACLAADIPLVHFSTDYVFDGEKGAPYVEADPRGPLNAYGRAKAEGEAALEALAADGARLATIRTCWVFSDARTGFVGAMVRRAAEHEEAVVVEDQWGSPTPARACADAALTVARALLDRAAAALGTFHAAGADGLSRADLAEAIFQRLPRRPHLRRVAADAYPTPARRPRDTRLCSAKLERALGWRAPSLGESLDACLLGVEALAR
jgi:dTDP-4-dehydrorhamnose reductase